VCNSIRAVHRERRRVFKLIARRDARNRLRTQRHARSCAKGFRRRFRAIRGLPSLPAPMISLPSSSNFPAPPAHRAQLKLHYTRHQSRLPLVPSACVLPRVKGNPRTGADVPGELSILDSRTRSGTTRAGFHLVASVTPLRRAISRCHGLNLTEIIRPSPSPVPRETSRRSRFPTRPDAAGIPPAFSQTPLAAPRRIAGIPIDVRAVTRSDC